MRRPLYILAASAMVAIVMAGTAYTALADVTAPPAPSTYPAAPSTEQSVVGPTSVPVPSTEPESGTSQSSKETAGTTIPDAWGPTDENGMTLYPPPPSQVTTTTKPTTKKTTSSATTKPTTTTKRTTAWIYNPAHPEDTYSGYIPQGERYTWVAANSDATGNTDASLLSESVPPDMTLPLPDEESGQGLPRWIIGAGAGAVLLAAAIGAVILIRKGNQEGVEGRE